MSWAVRAHLYQKNMGGETYTIIGGQLFSHTTYVHTHPYTSVLSVPRKNDSKNMTTNKQISLAQILVKPLFSSHNLP